MSLLSDNSVWTVLVNRVNGQLTNNKQFLFLITWTRQHGATRDKRSCERFVRRHLVRLNTTIRNMKLM